jgi:hypothetical protein
MLKYAYYAAAVLFTLFATCFMAPACLFSWAGEQCISGARHFARLGDDY